MQRSSFMTNGVTLSYLDKGGSGKPIVLLHGHWMEAQTFVPLNECLAPDWRFIALDQRGHGHSDHAQSYQREDYLNDLKEFLTHLHLAKVTLLGHSLGGVNAYQFAARHPDSVNALIIEDIGPTVKADASFVCSWAGSFPTKEALEERVGSRLFPYVQDSIRNDRSGWHLAFDPKDMVVSQNCLNGDHWKDWLASRCPALVIRGAQSTITTQEELQQMSEKRHNTQLVTLAGGHVVHKDNQTEFSTVLADFLRVLPQ